MIWSLLACASPSLPEVPAERQELRLATGWSTSPWRRAEGTTTSTVKVTLPVAGGPGTELVLPGLYWEAVVTVDGAAHPAVTGGAGAARVPLGALTAGEHTISLEIHPPVGVPRERTGGGRRPLALAGPPLLRLLPEEHVDAVALSLVAGRVTAHARVTARPGARVRVTVGGAHPAILGTADVTDGIAVTADTPWSGPTWAPGAPERVDVYVELLDGEAVVDVARVTTGVREVRAQPDGLWINGERSVLLTERLEEEDTVSARMRRGATGGANALEVHGVYLDPTWLDEADRLGVPLVVLPRCDGVSGPSLPFGPPHDPSGYAEEARRLVWDLAAHPSVLLFVNEGGEARYHPLFSTLKEDPLRRPIAGVDFPARSIGPERPVADVQGAWIVEQTATTDDAPARFLTAMHAGALGGALIPSPSQPDLQALWARRWSAASVAAGARPLPGFSPAPP